METKEELSFEKRVAEFERGLIIDALEIAGGNQAEAARQLGIRPNTLHYKIEKYGIKKAKSNLTTTE